MSLSTAADAIGTPPQPQQNYLVDPYKDWSEAEGIPIHTDFGLDLLALETGEWPRYDARGFFAHLHGRGDFLANYVIEVLPTRKTRPVKHLYEAFMYVLAGYGSTVVCLPDGTTRTFEFGPKALFAIPLNCTYQIFNGSSTEPVRLSCTNYAPMVINLFHNTDFIFDNDAAFSERVANAKHFEGEGDHSVFNKDSAKVQNMWETNYVHDLTSFKL